jgi:hypothetical protein
MNDKPEEATKALHKEAVKALKINIWKPVHLKDLSAEQVNLILTQMMNYLEKYRPDLSFEMNKVPVLMRGDKQKYPGETKGPVTRIETLLMFLSIEVHEDLKLFKIDIGSAFLQTPMADDMKHKSVRLDPLVVNILMDLKLAVYELYVLQDGIS